MFKVQYDKEVRIFQNIEKLGSFSQLKEVVRRKFKKCPEAFTFTFIDDEGDEITVQTDSDLECFISFIGENTKKKNLLKLNLQPTEQNLVQQSQAEISKTFEERNIYTQPSMYYPHTQEMTQQLNKLSEILPLQLQDFQTIQNLQILQKTQKEQEKLLRILRSNLKQIEDKIIQYSLDETYNQIIKEEASIYTDRNDSETAQIQILNQKGRSEIQNEREMSDIEDLEDKQLEQMVQKTLLKQMPIFIQQLSRKTIINVKKMVSLDLIKLE